MHETHFMNWKRWKMGLVVAAITGVCTAFAVGLIIPGMTPKEGALILAASIAKDLLLFLKDHPVESIKNGDTKTTATTAPAAPVK